MERPSHKVMDHATSRLTGMLPLNCSSACDIYYGPVMNPVCSSQETLIKSIAAQQANWKAMANDQAPVSLTEEAYCP